VKRKTLYNALRIVLSVMRREITKWLRLRFYV